MVLIRKKTQYVEAVWPGLDISTKTNKQQLIDGVKGMGYHRPKVIGAFKTLPGQGGEGGRSDVVIGFNSKDIGRLAVSPLHLGHEGFRWKDDYLAYNKDLIPEKAKRKFFFK